MLKTPLMDSYLMTLLYNWYYLFRFGKTMMECLFYFLMFYFGSFILFVIYIINEFRDAIDIIYVKM